jgi:hypothetical protein
MADENNASPTGEEAIFLKEELGVRRKLTTQAAEALETFDEAISAPSAG